MFPQNLEPPPWRIRPLKPCGVITLIALDFAAREVLGKRLCAKKPWISQATFAIIEQRRQAIRRGDVEEYRRLVGPRRRYCSMISSNGWSRYQGRVRIISYVARSKMPLLHFSICSSNVQLQPR